MYRKEKITLENLKVWIYGRPFSGKTKFATEFPKAFVINTDGNARFFTEDYVSVKNMKEFIEKLNWFLTGKHEYETLVIDVLEHVYDYTREYYLDKFDIDHESDLGYGKAWNAIKEGFWSIINKIASSQYNVVLLSHEAEYSEISKIGKETTKFKPALADKMHDRMCGILQLVGRAYVDEVMLNNEPVKKYQISFGSSVNELSGVRVPLKKTKIENTFEEFKNNIKEKK